MFIAMVIYIFQVLIVVATFLHLFLIKYVPSSLIEVLFPLQTCMYLKFWLIYYLIGISYLLLFIIVTLK